MVVMGTRPEAVKLAPVILELQRNTSGARPIVCVTGQHRQMLDQVMDWFSISADIDLALMQTNQHLAEFAARALAGLNEAVREWKPDAVIVQGDTTTAAMAALAAFYEKTPVAHVEAGLRTYELYNPFPEEMNRRIVGAIASFHFAPTERAEKALLAERVNPESVFCVGNTVVDALRITLEQKRAVELPIALNGHRRVLVTAHRRESFGLPFEEMCKAMRDIAERNADVEIIYPVHLNPNVRAPVAKILGDHERIKLIEPLRYEQFVHLMSECDLILTDSGGIQEEATVLGKPTLIMRTTTERREAVDCGTALLVGTDREVIVSSAERLLQDELAYRKMSSAKSPFGDGHSAEKIVDILASRV